MTDSGAGRYRIQAVAAMTGVSAPTLRAWERRYNIPQPQRTASAYRLYTEVDVQQVRQMSSLCSSGYSTAQAAEMVRQSASEALEIARLDPMAAIREDLLAATWRYDAAAIQQTLQQAMQMGAAVHIYENIIAPVMTQVGAAWAAGDLSLAQEHLLTGMVETLLRGVLQLVQPVDAPRSALLACYAHEEHVLGLYGAALRFAGWGYRVVFLGARVPPDAMNDAIIALRPDVVGLSNVYSAPQDVTLTQAYATALSDTPWVVGGPGAGVLRAAVQAHGGVAATSALEARSYLESRRKPG